MWQQKTKTNVESETETREEPSPGALQPPAGWCPAQQSQTPQRRASSRPRGMTWCAGRRWGRLARWHRRRQTHLNVHTPSATVRENTAPSAPSAPRRRGPLLLGEEERRTALTTMQRLLPPGRQDRTRRDTKWADDGLLCRLTRAGRAATPAWFRYRGQLSVGFGFNAPRAACQVYENKRRTKQMGDTRTRPGRTENRNWCSLALSM